jgi:GalNAc-alpha-(1->4)-GalNAc-alpha-(1->3)-diNAcBac-PP-undecaprenol alpha-1,4-N-acetyl-D-galactosaminyltransferase
VTSKTAQARRITILSGSLNGGGSERVVIDLCRHLRDSGREVSLLTLTGDDPDAYSVPDGVWRERMEVRRVPPGLFQAVSYLIGRLFALRRNILSLKPDVVVSFIDRVNVSTLVALFGTGVPVIVSERVHPGHNPISRAWLVARAFVYPFADAITVQTSDGSDWLKRHLRVKHVVVIPNALRSSGDLEDLAENTASQARPFIAAVGRMTEQKGFDLLLNAFQRSGLAETGWRLAILGEGPERCALERRASELGVASAVTLPGFVNVGPWLKRADIFVLSSRYEGFPNALLEAMQMGVGCVSFDCPSGPRDLIEDGLSGLLVPPEDVDGMADALQRLAANPILRSRIGAEGLKGSERFSPALVYKQWVNLMDDVVVRENG